MGDDLAGAEDGAASHGVTGGDEEWTSPEPGTARLAVASLAEARNGT
jgi:hypothetical protein